MLPKDQIAKIKVIKGPASVAYGANGMGGVINIVTKNGFSGPSTALDVELGENATRKLSLNHSGKVGPLNYWVSGYEQHSDGFSLSKDFNPTSIEDGGLREGTFYHKAGFTGKLGWTPSDKAVYSLSASYHWAEKSVPTTILSWDDPRYRYWPRWQRYGVSLTGQWTLSPLLEIRSVAYADANPDRFQEFAGAAMDPAALTFDSSLENWTLGGSTEAFIRPSEAHRLRLGLHFRRDLMNKKPDLDEPWYSHYHLTGSLFVEDQWQATSTTLVTLGAAGHGFRAEEEAVKGHLSPMVGLEQRLPWRLTLRAGWSNALRFPTMHMLYSSTSGNAGLKPEEADKVEFGLERYWVLSNSKNWQAGAEVCYYQNRLKNMIYRASRSFRYENISEADLNGLELSLALHLPPWARLDFQYAWIDAASASTELMEELPARQWALRVSGTWPLGIDYHYDFNYFDERRTYVSGLWLEAYALHHAGLSRAVGYGLTLKLEGRNLLDVDYAEELGYPSPGRQWFVGFSWKR